MTTTRNLNADIVRILSLRAQDEAYASTFYRAASGWCRDAGLNNSADYFAKEADDEQAHLQRLLDWLADWNEPIVVPPPSVVVRPSTLADILGKAYEMELALGDAYNQLRQLIWSQDLFTYDFLAFYTDVQARSVIEYNDLLKQYEGCKALGDIYFDRTIMAN